MPVHKMASLLSQEVIPWHEADVLSSPSRRKRSPCINSSAILLPTMRSPLFLCVLARRAALSVLRAAMRKAATGGDTHLSSRLERVIGRL